MIPFIEDTSSPLRASCIGKSHEKKITNTADKEHYDKMHERLQSPYAKKMKKLRQSTVEPVLGTLINYLGMRRINTRGIAKANKCMIMAAIAYNLKKLLKFATPTKINTKANSKVLFLDAITYTICFLLFRLFKIETRVSN